MNHLNYFHPYISKSPHHEDQLTRAYLVLLRYSFHCAVSFYDYCLKETDSIRNENNISETLPYLNELLQCDWIFETQKRNPHIISNLLISVLITDDYIEKLQTTSVIPSERNACYDGIISIGNEMTFIIEVKPRSQNVWFNQLSPSRENLSDDTTVFPKPIILQWKEIIKNLNSLNNFPTISSQEKMMINDFLEFVDDLFPALNPYDSFELCKNNEGLLERRIENVLKSITKDESKVSYHRGWGNIIRVHEDFDEIYQIGLISQYNHDDYSWYLDLCFSFADIVNQARAFYKRTIQWENLQASGWLIKPNFHVAFRSQGLVWFQSNEIQKYIDYWKNNFNEIRQYQRSEVEPALTRLNDNLIINYEESRKVLMDGKFFNKNMSKLNFCPGFSIIFQINSASAIKMDNEKKFGEFIKERIIEAFSLIDYKANDLKNVLK